MRLFVGNLSKNVRSDELKKEFESFGPCQQIVKVSYRCKSDLTYYCMLLIIDENNSTHQPISIMSLNEWASINSSPPLLYCLWGTFHFCQPLSISLISTRYPSLVESSAGQTISPIKSVTKKLGCYQSYISKFDSKVWYLLAAASLELRRTDHHLLVSSPHRSISIPPFSICMHQSYKPRTFIHSPSLYRVHTPLSTTIMKVMQRKHSVSSKVKI